MLSDNILFHFFPTTFLSPTLLSTLAMQFLEMGLKIISLVIRGKIM